jgi:hypothetical protein
MLGYVERRICLSSMTNFRENAGGHATVERSVDNWLF